MPKTRTNRKKVTSAKPVLSATLGTTARMVWSPGSERRPSLDQLLKRFGRYVYLCVKKKAQTCAAVKPCLYVMGGKEQVEKMHWLKPKALDVQTKAFLKGRCRLRPGNIASKRLTNIDDLTEVTAHPALDLLDNVNAWEEGTSFRISWYADLDLFARFFTNIVVDQSGIPFEFWRMLPPLMEIVRHEDKFVEKFKYGRTVPKKEFAPDDVFWVHDYDPDDPWGGWGWVEAWLKSIDADFTMAAFNQWLMNRGGAPDFVMISKGTMNQDQKRSYRTEFQSMFGDLTDPGRSNIAFQDGEGELVKLSQTPREMQYAESIQLMRDEICAAAGVPKSMVTTDDVNLANAETGYRQFVENTVWPMITRVEDAINQRLLPRWSDRLILVHQNPLKEDKVVRIQERESNLRSGGTVNEERLYDGKEPLDDPMADEPMIATGIVPLKNITEAGKPPPDPMGGMFGSDKFMDDLASRVAKALGTMQPNGRGAGNSDGSTLNEQRAADRAGSTARGKARVDPDSSQEQMQVSAEVGLGGSTSVHQDDGLVRSGNDDNRTDDGEGGLDGGYLVYPEDAEAITQFLKERAAQRGKVVAARIGADEVAVEGRDTVSGGQAVQVHDGCSRPVSQTAALHKAWEGVEDAKSDDTRPEGNHGRQSAHSRCCAGRLDDHDGESLQGRSVATKRDLSATGTAHDYFTKCWTDHLAVKEAQEDLPDSGSVRGFVGRMDKVLRKQIEEAIKAMTAQGLTEAAAVQLVMQVIADPRWITEIADAARPFLEGAIEIGGNFGAAKLSERLPDAIGFDVKNPEVQRFVDSYSTRLANGVNGYTEVRTRDLLQDGLDKGESIPELTERVQDWAGDANDAERATKHRAEAIARTESARAYVAGEEKAWEQSGVVEAKVPLLAPDACSICEQWAAQFEDKSVPLGQNFYKRGDVIEGADGARLEVDYDDIAGPPIHVNCRCDLLPILREFDGE